MTQRVMALDVGQTGIRGAVVGDREERRFSVSRGVEAIHDEPSLHRYATAVREAISSELVPGMYIAIGTTGYPTKADLAAAAADYLRQQLDASFVRLASDSVACFVASTQHVELNERMVVALTWGTGVVALASSGERSAVVDGRGHVLGDQGGGYWIGRRGLVSALDALDGRGGSVLLARKAQEFGQRPADIVREASVHGSGVAYVAAFAPAVVEAYLSGDVCSDQVLVEAADHAAKTAASAAKRVSSGATNLHIGMCGGLAGVEPLYERFRRAIRAILAPSDITLSRALPLDGVRHLARHPGVVEPFENLVSNSSRHD